MNADIVEQVLLEWQRNIRSPIPDKETVVIDGKQPKHARLDASRHDDCCLPRNAKPLRLHSMFTRVANSICCEWLSRHHKPKQVTIIDFRGAMAAGHDRAAISLVTSARPRLPSPKPQRGSLA